MRNYYRIMLGKGSMYAQECLVGDFIGVDYGIKQNLTDKLPDEWREFNKEFIPVFLAGRLDKSKVAAGLACGAVWTVSKGIQLGDHVVCPDGIGQYHVGEVIGDYEYHPGGILQHRRRVNWISQAIDKDSMSDALKGSVTVPIAVCNITSHAEEIENLLAGLALPKIISTDETIENPLEFVLEKHLEEFLVRNWTQIELGKDYDIYEDENENIGQQYPTDTGPIDILAVSKDMKTLLVIELKKGKASDVVVGQTLRYMGYVKEQLAEVDQNVKGIIIALEDDQRIRNALVMVPDIEFYRYQVSFKLIKG